MPLKRTLATTSIALSLLAGTGAVRAEEGWEIKTSPHSVADTVARLSKAIEAGGATVAATVDHAAAGRTVGLDLPPTTVVIFGNPKLGTPLMQQNRMIAIDLPQKILVWRDGEETKVGYVAPATLAARYSIATDDASVVAMTTALDKLSDAAIAPAG